MSQTVRGVISRKKGEPVEVVDVVIPDPGPGEVVVDVIACGVCHTDLTYREGGINDEYPSCSVMRPPARSVGPDGRHRGGTGRLRDPELARGVRSRTRGHRPGGAAPAGPTYRQ